MISLKFSRRLDLEDFKYNHVNMTAFRLVDSEAPQVKATLAEMETSGPIGKAILNQTQVINRHIG